MLPNDPIMLMSVVNTKLRDIYPSLERLCDDLDISERSLRTSSVPQASPMTLSRISSNNKKWLYRRNTFDTAILYKHIALLALFTIVLSFS